MVAGADGLLASDIFAAASAPGSSPDSENGWGPAGYPDGAGASADRARGTAPRRISGAQWVVHPCVSYRAGPAMRTDQKERSGPQRSRQSAAPSLRPDAQAGDKNDQQPRGWGLLRSGNESRLLQT